MTCGQHLRQEDAGDSTVLFPAGCAGLISRTHAPPDITSTHTYIPPCYGSLGRRTSGSLQCLLYTRTAAAHASRACLVPRNTTTRFTTTPAALHAHLPLPGRAACLHTHCLHSRPRLLPPTSHLHATAPARSSSRPLPLYHLPFHSIPPAVPTHWRRPHLPTPPTFHCLSPACLLLSATPPPPLPLATPFHCLTIFSTCAYLSDIS